MISVMMSSTVDTNKNEIMKPEENDNNDPREMDAADTLVALANTPTNEYKSNNFFKLSSSSPASSSSFSISPPPVLVSKQQQQQENKIEIILNNDQMTLNTSDDLKHISNDDINDNNNTIINNTNNKQLANVESACKLILQQVLKQCSVNNLSSITIKTTAVSNEKKKRAIINRQQTTVNTYNQFKI